MLCASLDLDRLRQARTSFRTEKIRQDCIDLLSSRIQDPGESLSDSTLVAVATLLAIEHDARNILAMNTHLAGLTRMVAGRGGLMQIRESSSRVANQVFW